MKPSETLEAIVNQWLDLRAMLEAMQSVVPVPWLDKNTLTPITDLNALRAALQLAEAVEGMPKGQALMNRTDLSVQKIPFATALVRFPDPPCYCEGLHLFTLGEGATAAEAMANTARVLDLMTPRAAGLAP